ncbi:MAG: hypothetical protein JNL67_12240 [Planctomycetaceae bacterium]|nr:hypothetical protein [Planctomycetaceae bacterium]
MDNADRLTDEVECLLQNARLRSELEPFLDEAVLVVDTHQMPTPAENQFLESLLAWESAPILPIANWFEPALSLQPAGQLDDLELHLRLHEVIQQLFEKQIVLEFTDHLSDRELYQLISRDILPSREKKVNLPDNRLVWHCVDEANDPELWLKHYATEEERDMWLEFNPDATLPQSCPPPYPRRLPR